MTYKDYYAYKLSSKQNKESLPLKIVVYDIQKIFNLNENEVIEILLDWIEVKSITLNNQIVSVLESNESKPTIIKGLDEKDGLFW